MKTCHSEEARQYIDLHPYIIGRYGRWRTHSIEITADVETLKLRPQEQTPIGTIYLSTIDHHGRQAFFMARKAAIYQRDRSRFFKRDNIRVRLDQLRLFDTKGAPPLHDVLDALVYDIEPGTRVLDDAGRGFRFQCRPNDTTLELLSDDGQTTIAVPGRERILPDGDTIIERVTHDNKHFRGAPTWVTDEDDPRKLTILWRD
jgi:hypothetical protein